MERQASEMPRLAWQLGVVGLDWSFEKIAAKRASV